MSLKEDRQAILDYCGYKDWTKLVRKSRRHGKHPNIWFKFHDALAELPLSEQFLYHYGPTIVDWHQVYWNKLIPWSLKETFRERIFWFWVENDFDRSVPPERRVKLLTEFFDNYWGLTLEEVIDLRDNHNQPMRFM